MHRFIFLLNNKKCGNTRKIAAKVIFHTIWTKVSDCYSSFIDAREVCEIVLAGREVPAVIVTELCENNIVERWLQGECDNEELCMITKYMADIR